MSRKISLIAIHCSATTSGRVLTRGTPGQKDYRTAAQIIDDWHFQRGFKRQPAAIRQSNPELKSIGYHFVIDVDGRVFPGRSVDEIGAHVQGFNAISIGICMVGGVELEGKYSSAQWGALEKLVADQAKALGVDRVFAKDQKRGICGHRDLSPDTNGNGTIESREWLKTCPGFSVQAWLERGMKPEPKHIYGGAQ